MFEIIPQLYLSSYQDIDKTLPDLFIINCTKELPMIVDEGIRIYVNDDMQEYSIDIMKKAIPYAIEVIDENIRKGSNVLVFCHMGRQRSATIVCAYLMKKKNYSYNDAINHMKQIKRDVFFGSVNFEKSIF